MGSIRLTMPPPGGEGWTAPEPGKAFVLTFSPQGMRFERGGSNLYISGTDGAHITIAGYFDQELAPFCTEDGPLVSGADFLMVMNPEMDLANSGLFTSFKKDRIVLNPGRSGRKGGSFPAQNNGLAPSTMQAEWLREAAEALGEEADEVLGQETDGMGKNAVRCWVGEEAGERQASIRELEDSISVSLLATSSAAHKAFLAYLALNEEHSSFMNSREPDYSVSVSRLFQDGPMGRAGITLRREGEDGILELAAEDFYTFQACYGGWLVMVFPSMRVKDIEIFMNAPSGQSVVDLQEYFSNAVFSRVPVAWSYGEKPKVTGDLTELTEDGFNLVELIDALELEQEQRDGPRPAPVEDAFTPHVEEVVLVHADTNDAVRLIEDPAARSEDADTSYRTFTFDEHSLLIEGVGPLENS